LAVEVVVVIGWLIVLTVVALGLFLLVKRRGGGRAGGSRDLLGDNGSKNVGERWRNYYGG